MKYEKGNWPTVKSRLIIASVRRVFESRNIKKLTNAAYNHIISHLEFIAHHDLAGFQNYYQNLAEFAEALLTSEYSNDLQYNMNRADRYIRGPYFAESCGQAYCQSVVEANFGILKLATDFLPALQAENKQAFEQAEKAELARLQAKYGGQRKKLCKKLRGLKRKELIK